MKGKSKKTVRDGFRADVRRPPPKKPKGKKR